MSIVKYALFKQYKNAGICTNIGTITYIYFKMNEKQKILRGEHIIIEDLALTKMINEFFSKENVKEKTNILISNVGDKTDEDSLFKLKILNGVIDKLTKETEVQRNEYTLLIESHKNLELEQANNLEESRP
jgi:hypothetical protein